MNKQQLNSSMSKSDILASANRLFAENGFENTTTKSIGMLANCSEALVFKYFKTKKGVLNALLSEWFNIRAAQLSKLAESQNLEEEIKILVTWFFNSYIEQRSLNKIFVSQSIANKDDDEIIRLRSGYVLKRNEIISTRIAKYQIPFNKSFTRLLDVAHGYAVLHVLIRNTPVNEYSDILKFLIDIIYQDCIKIKQP